MSLRAVATAQLETVQDLVLAAEHRYWEGLELMVHEQPYAGIYLMGYAAEMLLKTACFFFDGARPVDPAQARLAPIRRLGRHHLPGVPDDHFHSLTFWTEALALTRHLADRPLDPDLLAGLRACAARIGTNWWVEMRYRPAQGAAPHGLAVYTDVSWIRLNHHALWS
jgi:hypothetical protein